MSKLKLLARSVGLVVVLSVVGLVGAVGSASATTGVFSTSGEVNVAGSVSVTRAGGVTVQCPAFASTARIVAPSTFIFTQAPSGVPPLRTGPEGDCAGGTKLGLVFSGGATLVGSTWQFADGAFYSNPRTSPWGGYHASGFYGEWVNASGGNPSRVVLTNSEIGTLPTGGGGETLRVSGTLNVTTPAGGDVTVAP